MMTSVRRLGIENLLGWAVMLLVALSSAACGSDSNGGSPGAAGDGASGEPAVGVGGEPAVGVGGEPAVGVGGEPNAGEGGAGSPVTPGELVCKRDEDCSTREKPVCDQVLGCVACQYDWDCPAGHRCSDNACFEKRACKVSADCARDALHTVCDAVQQLCVGCREDAECGAGKRCEASECVAFEACKNSRDCADGKVCNRTVGACVACVVDGDCGAGSACVNDACVPTCASDKDCLGVGMLCDLRVARCVECLGSQDCPSQYFCAEPGRCTLDVCEQGQARCEGVGTLATCSELGDKFVASTCPGNMRCVEADDVSASCVPLICTPGGQRCTEDAGAVEHCAADGLEVASTEPCGQGKRCDTGSCLDVTCTPGSFACEGNRLYACNATGTQRSLSQDCGFQTVCDADAGKCQERTCYPKEHFCVGNVVETCTEDGLGTEPGGVDCGATNKGCSGGECRDKVCTGSYFCEGSELRRCENNGTSWSSFADCGFPGLCDSVGGKCIQPKCTPGAFTCDGNVATRCKADGSGYEAGGVDCTVSGLVCDGGGCLPKSCTAGATFCVGGSPVKCGPSGATYEATDTCTTDEYCVEGSSLCQPDVCPADAGVCNGSVATTCASDGSGPLPGGTNCASTQQACVEGACENVVCTPGAKSCQGDTIHACNGVGTGTAPSEYCAWDRFCDDSSGTATCSRDICSPGYPGCNGEVISTCANNGGSWVNPGADCKSTNEVCVLGGVCAAEEVATQGYAPLYPITGTNNLAWSSFRALSARKLGRVEVYASFTGLQKVTWVVYEARASTATYDLVYQKVTAHTAANAGFITSPPLDFTLQKGKRYAVGAHIAGTSMTYYYYYAAQAEAAFITDAYGGYTETPNSTQPNASVGFYNGGGSVPYLRFTTKLAP